MKLSVVNSYSCDESEQFRYLKSCGFDGCDFIMNRYFLQNGIYGDIDNVTDSMIKERFTWLKALADEADFKIFQSHASFGGRMCKFEGGEPEVIKRVTASIKATHYLGAKNVVIHPYINLARKYDKNEAVSIQQAIDLYSKFIPVLEEYDMYCCIENMFNRADVHKHICPTILSRAKEMVYVCEQLGDRFKICLDVGHCTVTEDDPVEAVYICGDRLACLHTHDNDGMNDLHTFPYCAQSAHAGLKPMRVDWTAFMKALKDIGYGGVLSFEITAPGPDKLKPAGLRYLAAIGRHLSDIYENHTI